MKRRIRPRISRALNRPDLIYADLCGNCRHDHLRIDGEYVARMEDVLDLYA